MAQPGKLDEKYCALCDKVLESIPLIEERLKQCENCGLDVSEYKEQLKLQADMAAAIKREFFPHRT